MHHMYLHTYVFTVLYENIINFSRSALACTSLPDKMLTMHCLEILETINFSRILLWAEI